MSRLRLESVPRGVKYCLEGVEEGQREQMSKGTNWSKIRGGENLIQARNEAVNKG